MQTKKSWLWQHIWTSGVISVRLVLQDKTVRVLYVWALCRDQEELDPLASWKLLDISASTSEQWL